LHYYFLTPIQNYAGIDSMEKADNEWSAKIGKEKSDALMKGYEGTFEYYKTGVIRSLPGLSYIPKAPKYKPEEENFVSWGFASVEFGKGEEFSSICKQYIALYDSAKIPVGWRMYVGLMGMEMPFYFWAETARSAAEYYADGEKVTKTVGETKSTELWNKTMAVCKKYESKIGRPRPDLSNKPKGK
jgi:hypothetical protein